MSYQRVLWHSGLTYRCVCPACRGYTIYTDYNLGFRSWFPDGFVYCSHCRRPVRHNENNAIKPDGSPYFPFPIRTPPPPGYSAYSLESLALQQPYGPQAYPQQPGYAPQPPVQQPGYAPQPPAQQPGYAPQPPAQPVQGYMPQQAPPPGYTPVPPAQPPGYTPMPPVQPMQQPYQQQVQQPMQQAPAAASPTCPKCGAPYIVGDSLFCANCGTRLVQESTPAAPEKPMEPAVLVEPAAPTVAEAPTAEEAPKENI